MKSPLGNLVRHLLAATSMPLAVVAALAFVSYSTSYLAPWLDLDRLVQILGKNSLGVVAGIATLAYAFYFGRTVASYTRGGTSSEISPSPPRLERVTLNFWTSLGGAVGVFLVLLGVAWVLGLPARLSGPKPVHFAIFEWGEAAIQYADAAIFVFVVTLTSTYGLRGIARSFHYDMHQMRPREWRRNLPLEVALVATLPVFVAMVIEISSAARA